MALTVDELRERDRRRRAGLPVPPAGPLAAPIEYVGGDLSGKQVGSVPQWDGTKWTAKFVESRNEENVRWFGAKGDGVTDDRPAIQAALDAAGSWGDVFFPEGVYALGGPIVPHHKQRLIGCHKIQWYQEHPSPEPATLRATSSRIDEPVCVLKPLPSFTPFDDEGDSGGAWLTGVIVHPNATTETDRSSHGGRFGVELDHLGIEGNRQLSDWGDPIHGVLLHGHGVDWKLRHVEIANCTGHGIYAQPKSGLSPMGTTFDHVFSHNNAGSGFRGKSQDSTFLQSWFHLNDADGFKLESSGHVEIIGCKAEGNGNSGFAIAGSEAILLGCRTDLNNFAGIYVGNAAVNRCVSIVGCGVYRDGRTGGTAESWGAGVYIEGQAGQTPVHGPVHIADLQMHAQEYESPIQGSNVAGPYQGVLIDRATDVFIDGTVWGRVAAVSLVNGASYRAGAGLRLVTGADELGTAGTPPFTVDGSTGLLVAKGHRVREGGGNARMGVATLVAGTVTVNTTAIGANSRVFLTPQTSGAAPGALRVSARTAGTSFTITSSSGTDTSQVAWMIVDPG